MCPGRRCPGEGKMARACSGVSDGKKIIASRSRLPNLVEIAIVIDLACKGRKPCAPYNIPLHRCAHNNVQDFPNLASQAPRTHYVHSCEAMSVAVKYTLTAALVPSEQRVQLRDEQRGRVCGKRPRNVKEGARCYKMLILGGKL